MKIPIRGKCYVCDGELESGELECVDKSNQMSQLTIGYGKGEKIFYFKGTMHDYDGEQVACCKNCVVGALLMAAKTLSEIHGVDSKNLN